MAKTKKKRSSKRTSSKSSTKPGTIPKAWPASNVEPRAVSSLIPYARNARLHGEDEVKKLAASIKEWGWTNPILTDPKGNIIAGHGRVLAAELLGIKTVPTMIAKGWSEAQKRAYTIADNQLGLISSWDHELLGAEIEAIQGLDLDLMGFAPADLTRLVSFNVNRKGNTGSKGEIDVDAFDLEHQCPRCGFEFNEEKEEGTDADGKE